MVAAERQRLGLNDPFFTQYFRFLGGLFTGDLGRSLRTRQPVTSDIATYLPATVELVVTAFLIALVLAALYAMSGALRWPGAAIGRGVLLLLATAPPFLLALVGIIVFFGQLGWLPARGVGDFEDPGPFGMQAVDTLLHGQADAFVNALRHLVLPAVVLSIAPAVAIGRVLRSSLQAVLDVDYVRTARSKGLTEPRWSPITSCATPSGPPCRWAGCSSDSCSPVSSSSNRSSPGPVSATTWPPRSRSPTSPRSPGSRSCSGRSTSCPIVVVDLLQALADPRVAAE